MTPLDALLARSPNARRPLAAPDRTRILLAGCFGAPLPFHVVKITGTNGKGSVCAMLAACLSAGGVVTGRFTSPHLWDVAERVMVNGGRASRAELDAAAAAVAPKLDRIAAELGGDYVPTYFEALLLVALEAFGTRGVKVALLEAGIGGAYDAVSAVPGVLSIVSGVGLDHVEQLGGTEAAIARNKAGIAAPSTTLVVGGSLSDAARGAIADVARERNLRAVWAHGGRVSAVAMDLEGSTADVAYQGSTTRVRLALAGRYQLANLETTIAALEALPDDLRVDAHALRGLTTVRWPGRFETLGRSPRWLLDAAHNPQGVAALGEALDDLVPYDERALLCGVSMEHQSAELAGALRRLAPRIHVADGYYRAAPAAGVAAALGPPAEPAGDVDAAVRLLRGRYASGATIVVTGSLYLVGAVRRELAPS